MKKGSVVVIIILGVIALGVWQVLAPRRHAEKARRQIQVGMTLPEVLAVTPGWLSCDGHSMGAKVQYAHIYPSGRSEIEEEGSATTAFENREESHQALRNAMKKSGVEWVFGFDFIAVPGRVYFSVSFGPDGKVRRVSDLEAAGE